MRADFLSRHLKKRLGHRIPAMNKSSIDKFAVNESSREEPKHIKWWVTSGLGMILVLAVEAVSLWYYFSGRHASNRPASAPRTEMRSMTFTLAA